jgi:cell division topological specificity factor
MSLLSFFNRKNSAPVARDRLQILLAHERSNGEGQSDLIAKLREEILAVIAKHVTIDRDKVQVKLDRGASVSTLEIDIEVPGLKSLTRPPERPEAQPAPG